MSRVKKARMTKAVCSVTCETCRIVHRYIRNGEELPFKSCTFTFKLFGSEDYQN